MSLSVTDLIEKLKANPHVIGLVRYGSRPVHADSPGGDFDLFAFVHERDEDLEGIHFYWGELPVDLGLRTLDDLKRDKPVSFVDANVVEGEILFDRNGDLHQHLEAAYARWNRPGKSLSEPEIMACRFYQTHVLNKVKDRLESHPLFCEMLLSTNITWLLHIYFKIRAKSFPGEKAALEWIQEEEPEMFGKIESFFQTREIGEKFRLSVKLTDLVLAPTGGRWIQGEVLGLSENLAACNLKRKAETAFRRLLCVDPAKAAV